MINWLVIAGVLSKEWERVNVIPIHKNGDKENPLAYRPVITSVLCKLCERTTKKKCLDHLKKEKIISDSQVGLAKGDHEPNLLCFHSGVTDSSKGRWMN